MQHAAFNTQQSIGIPALAVFLCVLLSCPTHAADSVKIGIEHDGLYRVQATELAPLFVLSVAQTEALLAGHELRLTCRGVQTAYHTDGSNLFFYGQGTDSIYTRENVYRLERGPGTAMTVLPGTGPSPFENEQAFTDTLHFEENHYALTGLFHDPESDFWLWDYLAPPYRTNLIFNLFVPSPAAAGGPASLTTHLQGATDAPADPDHDTAIELNGNLLGRLSWSGKTDWAMEVSFDQALVQAGQNTVRVVGERPAGVSYSVFYVDSFDLSYRRGYEAYQGRLRCEGQGQPVITVRGFADPQIRVLDVANPALPVLVQAVTIDETNGLYRASFVPAAPDRPYALSAEHGLRSPAWLRADRASYWRTPTNEAHQVIICPPALLAAAAPLADYRRAQWLKVALIDLEDLYDEFNFGLPDPHAIRAFLQYAQAQWQTPPRFVLLAGNGTYDYQDNQGLGTCLIPPLMVDTPYGLHESDNRLADLDADGVPDLAIGRLPVLTEQDMAGAITKIQNYEAGGAWKQRVVMVADNPDAGGNFPADSDTIAGLVPAPYNVDKFHYPTQTLAEVQAGLADGFTAGSRLTHYIGHGTRTKLGPDEDFLTLTDVNALNNVSNPPITLAMSCSIARYAVPGYDSIGRALAAKPDGGAVAVWASVALVWNSSSLVIDYAFFDALFTARRPRLGEAVLAALRRYGEVGSQPYHMDVYAFLGDPALRLEYWSGADTDGDGLPDGVETDTGLFVDETNTGTDPTKPDSDGDTLTDGDELARGTDPNKADTDGDGFRDDRELAESTNPLDDQDYPLSDLIVSEPHANDWVLAGDELTVSWSGRWPLGQVEVMLFTPSASWPLARALDAPGSNMTWQTTLPWRLRYGTDYRVRVRATTHPNDTAVSAPFTVRARVRGDFDGDGIADPALYYPAAGMWYLWQSRDGFLARPFGWSAAVPAAADFDGDGRTDIAVYYPPAGQWYIAQSTAGFRTEQFGFAQTVPLPRDYDGDGRADIAIFHAGAGMWYLLQTTEGYRAVPFGWDGPSPVPADYDGDWRCDVAVADSPGGVWYVLGSTAGYWREPWPGRRGAVPAPGDYDGDGRTDPGSFEPATGTWYWRPSSGGWYQGAQFGWHAVVPVQGDYDGDGVTDLAVYHPQTGMWYLMQSSAGFAALQFGWAAAVPVLTAGWYD